MKVLFIVFGSIRTLSGGYLYDRLLISALEKKGHQVLVLSQQPRTCYPAQILDNADPALLRQALRYAPDLVVEDELNHAALFLLNRRLRAMLGVPIIGLVHHLRQLERHGFLATAGARYIEKVFLTGLDGYLCNSEFTRRSIQTALGLDPAQALPKPFVIALPGHDRLGTAPETAAGSTDGPGATMELRVLFLGNVIPRKGVHVLVAALGGLEKSRGDLPAWRLSIAGNDQADPRYTRRLKRAGTRLGIDGQISWLGAVRDQDLPTLFRAHDLLAVPSQCEGFGIVYAEALRAGLPVIAGTNGGAAEIIDDGINGFLLDWEDTPGLTALLVRLAENPTRLQEMKNAARLRAAHLPGWAESMNRAVLFLESISRPG